MNPQQELIRYYALMKTPSECTLDIHEHLDTLKRYASKCDHVTEMGFLSGVSFTAFLAAQPKTLITYDLKISQELVDRFSKINCRTNVHFIPGDTLKIDIEETDLLFIDTLHTYTHLKEELKLHGNKAKKYLVFHDIDTFGTVGEDGEEPGLLAAIKEFMDENPHWEIAEVHQNNNGLLILKRCTTQPQ